MNNIVVSTEYAGVLTDRKHLWQTECLRLPAPIPPEQMVTNVE